MEEPKIAVLDIPSPAPVVEQKEEKQPGFECVSCLQKATLLFEGTSYCRTCLKEDIRTGKL
jgi:uncharacterized protein CbrC (UPF0167 family)